MDLQKLDQVVMKVRPNLLLISFSRFDIVTSNLYLPNFYFAKHFIEIKFNQLIRTYFSLEQLSLNYFFKWAIPGFFFFIFVFSIHSWQ